MFKRMTRRRVLSVGASAAVLFTGQSCSTPVNKPSNQSSHPSFLSPWSPPPDLERDLTPGTTQIRLASWSNTTTLDYPGDNMSITELVKRIRDAGYTSGNARGGRTSDPWLEASEADIRELKDALKKYDVTFFDMHAVANNVHPDADERESDRKYVCKALEAAERVECPMVTTHIGTRSLESNMAPHKDNWTMDTWNLGVNSIKQILKDTSGMKASLGMEPINMTPLNNPRAFKRFLEDVGDPRCKVCIDPVNMMNMSVYLRNTELINESFDLLGENIMAGHAKDTYVLPNRMSVYLTENAPGQGILDYETYLVRLSRLSYPRSLLIEHIPDEQYAGAKKYIEENAARVGVKLYV
ncbi:sugar phosphate isomerase/epimerase family protein [Candidatus Latescibacterota bacterium]